MLCNFHSVLLVTALKLIKGNDDLKGHRLCPSLSMFKFKLEIKKMCREECVLINSSDCKSLGRMLI